MYVLPTCCTARGEVTGFKGMGLNPHLKILGEKKAPTFRSGLLELGLVDAGFTLPD
jgi:hypothetical protein